jgi:dihydroneopterin aldolase
VDRITISDLAVTWRVGVTEEERAEPQVLLLTIEMEVDFAAAAKTDDLAQTIDYFAVSERIRQWGENKSWKLIERVARDVAELVLADFRPVQAAVEVKKFVLPETAYVSAKVNRQQPAQAGSGRKAGLP